MLLCRIPCSSVHIFHIGLNFNSCPALSKDGWNMGPKKIPSVWRCVDREAEGCVRVGRGRRRQRGLMRHEKRTQRTNAALLTSSG